MSEVSVRPAVSGDLPSVNRLLVETWHATYDDIYGRETVNDWTLNLLSMDHLVSTRANVKTNLNSKSGVIFGAFATIASSRKNLEFAQVRVKQVISRPKKALLPSRSAAVSRMKSSIRSSGGMTLTPIDQDE